MMFVRSVQNVFSVEVTIQGVKYSVLIPLNSYSPIIFSRRTGRVISLIYLKVLLTGYDDQDSEAPVIKYL